MAVKIRLRRGGRINRPSYRFVVTDSRNPRDGVYLEMIGWYNPLSNDEVNVSVDAERLQFWLDRGAVLTEKAETLVAKAAPQVIKRERDKVRARRLKLAQKRKASRKTAESKTAKSKPAVSKKK